MSLCSLQREGRFIEFCKPTVDEWSEKLQTVDAVLQVGDSFREARTVGWRAEVWRKFQVNWCRLEPLGKQREKTRARRKPSVPQKPSTRPIFMQSDDIRSQLPDDSKRFELLDNSWKEPVVRLKSVGGGGLSACLRRI